MKVKIELENVHVPESLVATSKMGECYITNLKNIQKQKQIKLPKVDSSRLPLGLKSPSITPPYAEQVKGKKRQTYCTYGSPKTDSRVKQLQLYSQHKAREAGNKTEMSNLIVSRKKLDEVVTQSTKSPTILQRGVQPHNFFSTNSLGLTNSTKNSQKNILMPTIGKRKPLRNQRVPYLSVRGKKNGDLSGLNSDCFKQVPMKHINGEIVQGTILSPRTKQKIIFCDDYPI